MKPLARALGHTLRALGIDRDVARADAVREWREAAAEVLGADARATRAVRADGDTLVIVVPTAQWAGEIRLREREILQVIARRAPESRISRLRCVPSP